MPPSLLAGLLLGLLQLGGTLAVYAAGLHAAPDSLEGAHQLENLAAFVAMMGCVCLGLRAVRLARHRVGTPFTFGTGARATLVIASLGGLVTALGQYLYVAAIHPAYAGTLRALYIANTQLDPEQTAAYAEQLDLITSPLFRAVSQGVTTLFFTLMMGLVYALLFRDRPAAVSRENAD